MEPNNNRPIDRTPQGIPNRRPGFSSSRPYNPARPRTGYRNSVPNRGGVAPRPNIVSGVAPKPFVRNDRPRANTQAQSPATHGPRRTGGRGGGRRMDHKRPGKMMQTEFREQSVSQKERVSDLLPPIGDALRIIPLGGVEEIGRNMTAIEFGNDIIVIDCGIQFTNAETPGVDYILPNTRYLEENKHKVRAVVITHGHLDHIGSIPYIMPRIGNPPIYTREFAALLIKKRQAEFPQLPPLEIKIMTKDDGFIAITPELKVRFFGVTHAIPDSTGVIIETPYGDIVNTGDLRVDNLNGIPTEEEFAQYEIFKKRKILILLMDSTGIEKPGWCLSEDIVIANIDKIVAEVPGRIFIATFASQVERIIEFIRIAAKYGKKVVVEGRSMKNNVEIIKFLNLADTKHVISVEDIEQYPPHKLLILATGAQGEEFAALMRMANQTHKQLRLNKTDTIILSSSVIPGNDRAVAKLKDNLYHHDARIITHLDSDVHTSGHGKRGELEWIHHQIPYKYFMPVHGHHYMLKMHAELAREMIKVPADRIVVPENGSVIEITENGNKIAKLKNAVVTGDMVVEGFTIGDIQEVVIRDRQLLAQDGMFVIIASINAHNGTLKKSPDIISRGFIYLRESQDLLRDARLLIKNTIEETTAGMNPINFDYVKEAVTESVSKFLFQETSKHPIVIPVIIGV